MKHIIRKVALIGGTHGNELTGIHLLKRWVENPAEVTRPSFVTQLFLANPKAFAENRRFIDDDLNRCFGNETLRSQDSPSYEVNRAAVLNRMIGPKGDAGFDFAIDLHTSTSHCGAMLILVETCPFNVRLAAYIVSRMPEARVFYIPPDGDDQPYLTSICPRGLGVEVGPIPQGLLRYDTLALSNAIVKHALDFAHHENGGGPLALPDQVEVFRLQEVVKFPASGQYLEAVVHESLQGRDYQPLNPGDAIFRKLNGETIEYEGSTTVYPVFINEAAYYYRRIAMSLTVKESLKVPT